MADTPTWPDIPGLEPLVALSTAHLTEGLPTYEW